MRPPVKRLEIVKKLKQEILSGAYVNRNRLPVEPELAAMLGITRKTLRGALDILEKEGLLERIPGKGTFLPHRSGGDVGNVFLLLPCSDYLLKSDFHSARHPERLSPGGVPPESPCRHPPADNDQPDRGFRRDNPRTAAGWKPDHLLQQLVCADLSAFSPQEIPDCPYPPSELPEFDSQAGCGTMGLLQGRPCSRSRKGSRTSRTAGLFENCAGSQFP